MQTHYLSILEALSHHAVVTGQAGPYTFSVARSPNPQDMTGASDGFVIVTRVGHNGVPTPRYCHDADEVARYLEATPLQIVWFPVNA